MNKERILKLADVVERQKHAKVSDSHGFNMGEFRHECGTPSCIAGWACALKKRDKTGMKEIDIDVFSQAKKYLGLSAYEADELFIPSSGYWSLITPSQAAATLRNLAETGEVVWNVEKVDG